MDVMNLKWSWTSANIAFDQLTAGTSCMQRLRLWASTQACQMSGVSPLHPLPDPQPPFAGHSKPPRWLLQEPKPEVDNWKDPR
jgi:hypothetical protein